MARVGVGLPPVLLLLLGACGGGSGNSSKLPDPPAGGYRLTLHAGLVSDGNMVVSGTSNLPAGTVVSVDIERSVVDLGRTTEEAAATPLGAGDARTGKNAYATTIEFVNGARSSSTEFDPTSVISPNVTVCARVETGLDQDGKQRQPLEKVRAAIGQSGEAFVANKAAYTLDALTSTPSTGLLVMTSVAVPPPLAAYRRQQNEPPVVQLLKALC